MIAGPHGAGKTEVMVSALGSDVMVGSYVAPQDTFESLRMHYSAAEFDKEEVPDYAQRAIERTFTTRFGHMNKLKDITVVCSLGAVEDLDLLDGAYNHDYHISLYFFGVNDWRTCDKYIRETKGHWLSKMSSEDVYGDYHRSLAMLPGAILLADTGMIFDNSDFKNPKPLLAIKNGRVEVIETKLPNWILEPLSRCL